MSIFAKILCLIFLSGLVISCCKDNNDIDQTKILNFKYVIEMSKNFRISKVSYFDPYDAWNGDGDFIAEYIHTVDSVVIKSILQKVGGGFVLETYYLNNNGLADSSSYSYHRYNDIKIPVDVFKNYYFYNDSNYLISDTTKCKRQNSSSYTLYSTSAYEYSNENLTREIRQLFDPVSSWLILYTYTSLTNIFSFNGSYKGKLSKNLIKTMISTNQNGDEYCNSYEYILNSSGLVEEKTSTSCSGSEKYITRFEYIIID
jgi:hypothetical protein